MSDRVAGVWALAVVAGLAASVSAQDSTSRNANGGNGLPGDALSPFLTGANQRSSYVVDLVPVRTSWGTSFGIAPVMKSGRTSAARFNAVNGSSSISQTLITNATLPAASYVLWNQPTAGISAVDNNAGLNSTTPAPSGATVFGVGFMDYEDATVSSTSAFLNQIVGGVIGFDPAAPSRLYVQRVVAATNSPSGQVDRSQFGYGAIDAAGNVVFRADGLTATSTTNVLGGDNFFRVRLPARATTINAIDVSGAVDAPATSWLLNNAAVTHNIPNLIPADLAGRSVLIGSNFVTQLVSESSAGVLSTSTAHRPNAVDHRGSVGFSARPVFAGSVGTGGMVTRSLTGGGRPDAISVFGLDANGGVTTARTLTLPATIQDTCDASLWPVGSGGFRHYDSQVTFRGGGSQVAVGQDQLGRAIAAAVVYNGSTPDPANPYNAIAAVRFDPSNPASAASWTVVAWTATPTTDGKDILGDFGGDGAPNTGDAGENDGVVDASDAPIGRIASLSELSLGKTGPSMSAPMIDSVGNIYFVASVALRKQSGAQIVDDYTQALLRAVYQPATMCYSLELVLKLGDTFVGANSAKRYQVAFLGLTDADSISSSAPWSSSMTQAAWNNQSTAGLAPSDPRTLGGLVLSARIVYDVNGDQAFEDPTVIGGNASSTDEAYNVILYVGNTTTQPVCVADVDDGSGTGTTDGGVGIEDLLYYLGIYDLGVAAADVDDGSGTGTLDGGVGIEDLLYFLLRYDNGC